MTSTLTQSTKTPIANSTTSAPQATRPLLTAKWDIIDGKLVCRWLLA